MGCQGAVDTQQTALERHNLRCTYLAHHEPESIMMIIIVSGHKSACFILHSINEQSLHAGLPAMSANGHPASHAS